MENNIKELEGFENNYFIKIMNAYSTYNNTQTLRTRFEQKLEKIKILKNQIKILKFESLDLNEEITRLLKEIEVKELDERYR